MATNPHEEEARAKKVLAYVAAIDRLLPDIVEAWGPHVWAEIATRTNRDAPPGAKKLNLPSATTIAQIVQHLRDARAPTRALPPPPTDEFDDIPF